MGLSRSDGQLRPGSQGSGQKCLREDVVPKRLASIVGAPGRRDGQSDRTPGRTGEAGHQHPKIEAIVAEIRREAGKLVVHNDLFKIKPEFQQSAGKLGLKAFARQVEYSQEAGFDRIETTAYRDKRSIDPATGKERWSGYYAWPRFGYDGPIPNGLKGISEWRQLPPHLQQTENVSELITDPIGRSWWRQYGDMIDVTFDLRPESYSMKTLNAYLQENLPVVK